MWANNYQNPYMGMSNNFAQAQSINLVQGYDGAKAYQMGANSTAFLKDNVNDGYMYIKTTDSIGVANIETYVKTEPPAQNMPSNDLSEYVKKSELSGLIKGIIGGAKDE
jgi:hypothetical protein